MVKILENMKKIFTQVVLNPLLGLISGTSTRSHHYLLVPIIGRVVALGDVRNNKMADDGEDDATYQPLLIF